MSDSIENLTKDLVEDAMTNALESSVLEREQGINGKSDEREDDVALKKILQETAQLAEGLQRDLERIQIGDYTVSINRSPLEIQLKRAISNLEISDTPPNVILIKGDAELKETNQITLDSENPSDANQSPKVVSSDPNLSSPYQSNDDAPTVAPETTKDSDKRATFGKRLRRFFRFGSRHRKSS